jgi:redox-sensitive bicupin YhaK (pirin superfamily)
MSWTEASDPQCATCPTTPAVARIIDARARDLGGFAVGRVLPSAEQRLVGPFIFFDHMGPAEFPPDTGMDVRPHPHVNLATVTYLFEGEIVHRDSLGSEQTIRPGAINWMTAGRGIVHSERTPAELRRTGFRVHGLQLWVALPKELEETEPDFRHYPAESLPRRDLNGVSVCVMAGSAYGMTSPVRTLSRLLYVEAVMPAGTELAVPPEEERAAYVVDGVIACGAERASAGRMLVFAEGSSPVLRAETRARVVLIGGAPIDGPRHVYWNFVSSSKERIERAKVDWREGRFPKVPGDEEELIPLPDGA